MPMLKPETKVGTCVDQVKKLYANSPRAEGKAAGIYKKPEKRNRKDYDDDEWVPEVVKPSKLSRIRHKSSDVKLTKVKEHKMIKKLDAGKSKGETCFASDTYSKTKSNSNGHKTKNESKGERRDKVMKSSRDKEKLRSSVEKGEKIMFKTYDEAYKSRSNIKEPIPHACKDEKLLVSPKSNKDKDAKSKPRHKSSKLDESTPKDKPRHSEKRPSGSQNLSERDKYHRQHKPSSTDSRVKERDSTDSERTYGNHSKPQSPEKENPRSKETLIPTPDSSATLKETSSPPHSKETCSKSRSNSHSSKKSSSDSKHKSRSKTGDRSARDSRDHKTSKYRSKEKRDSTKKRSNDGSKLLFVKDKPMNSEAVAKLECDARTKETVPSIVRSDRSEVHNEHHSKEKGRTKGSHHKSHGKASLNNGKGNLSVKRVDRNTEDETRGEQKFVRNENCEISGSKESVQKDPSNGMQASDEIILKKNGSNVTRRLFQATGPPDLLSQIMSKMDAPLGTKKKESPAPSNVGMGFLL